MNKRIDLLHKEQGTRTGADLVRDTVEEHHRTGREITVSFSGGRDSLAVALIALDALEWRTPTIVYNDTTNAIPASHGYVMDMLDWFRDHYSIVRTEVLTPDTSFGELKEGVFRRAARMYYGDERWEKRRLRCCENLKKKPFKDYCRTHAVEINVCGMRALESSVRYALFVDRGPTYHMKTLDLYRVNPLWDWTMEQVDRFLEGHPLDPPINPIYEQGFGGTGCFMCPIKWLWDEESRETLKREYPQVYEQGRELLEQYRGKGE